MYYTHEITPADLVGRTLWELALLRNTIVRDGSQAYPDVAKLRQSFGSVSQY